MYASREKYRNYALVGAAPDTACNNTDMPGSLCGTTCTDAQQSSTYETKFLDARSRSQEYASCMMGLTK